MKHALCLALALPLLAAAVRAEEFALVDKQQPVSRIVISGQAGPAERHAAAELGAYLMKISASTSRMAAAGAPAEDGYNIFIGTAADAALVAASGVDAARLEGDAFAIAAKPGGLYLIGARPIGALYGAYEILKRYGGIRWLVPGAEGEYFTPRGTIAVPEQLTYHAPSYPQRTIGMNCANVNSLILDSWDWMVRNNLFIQASVGFLDKASPLSAPLRARAARSYNGGHCLDTLMTGAGVRPKEAVRSLDDLFRSNPEFFPMINGRRVPLSGHAYQPCTSNPKLLDLMAGNLALWVRDQTPDGNYLIGNMDGTGWCQCEDCRKLDPPGEREKGFVSTRYWTLVTELANRVWKTNPKARFGGWAYQNFQVAPTGLALDPRLDVYLSFNRRCYRHALTDPACAVNAVFCTYFDTWKDFENVVWTRDEVGASGSKFAPMEYAMTESIKAYPKYNLDGMGIQSAPPDGVYGSRYDAEPMVKWTWYGMWQATYLSARFLWDKDSDYATLAEEANALYYGKAWDAGMREFRQLLEKAFHETPGCFGWGLGAPLGRCLEKPGVREKLRALLEQAELAVVDDFRALGHVIRDRTMFDLTWEKARRDYLANYRELKVYRRAAPIVVNGVIDEPDWKQAEAMPPFIRFMGSEPAELQTTVKVVYEPEALYFAIEALEPEPDRLKALADEPDSPRIWGDNEIEVFVSHPDQGGSYHHFALKHLGAFYDAFNQVGDVHEKTAFASGAELKTKVLQDRWVAELRIPTAPLGMACSEGHVWKVNVARSRRLTDDTREMSSAGAGQFHNADNFVNLIFAGTP